MLFLRLEVTKIFGEPLMEFLGIIFGVSCLSDFPIRFTGENTKSCDVNNFYPQDIVDFQPQKTQDMVYSDSSNRNCIRINVAYKYSNTRDMREA